MASLVLSHERELNSALSLRVIRAKERSLGIPPQTTNRTPMADSLQRETRVVQKKALARKVPAHAPFRELARKALKTL
jgi:hypothetical protein